MDSYIGSESQASICRFARLTREFQQNQQDIQRGRTRIQELSDSLEELNLNFEDTLYYKVSTTFMELNEDQIADLINQELNETEDQINRAVTANKGLETELSTLKKELYGIFGNAVYLEA